MPEQAAIKQASVLEDFILDPWTSLSFKRMIGDRRMAGVSYTVAGWVGQEHARRLMSYKLRHMYYENAARHALPTGDAKAKSEHREYGDAAVLVETVRSALIGISQSITISGTEDPEPSAEEKQSQTLVEQLRIWADKETFPLKLIENERNACKLGDAVYALGWDTSKKRARLSTYDPGFYFPVLETRGQDDYPKRIHIAWEVPSEVLEDTRIRVRRITWELRKMPDGQTRALPWNDEPTDWTCYMSDGIWTLDRATEETVDNFTSSGVEWQTNDDGIEIRDLDIEVDFIPVVHVPCTVAMEAHYGSSVIDKVCQILDDLSKADSDLQQAATLAGFPPIAVSRARLDSEKGEGNTDKIVTYGPGTAFEVGDGGMDALDLSSGVRALIEYVNHLIDRLEINSRVPAGILGRISPAEVPSGIALALSFGPLHTMINEMRLVRREKYRLMLRFVVRFMAANGVITELPEKEPEVVFGPYMQVDTTAIVNQVASLLGVHAISASTALLMLIEAGLPIEDAAQEIERLRAEDFDGANRLLDATDDPVHVRKYLQIPGPVPEPRTAPDPERQLVPEPPPAPEQPVPQG